MSKVVKLKAKRKRRKVVVLHPHYDARVDVLYSELQAVVDKRRCNMTYAAIVGTLELLKADIINEKNKG